MKVVSRILGVRRARFSRRHHRVGFVPTMGAFHAGHIALMRQAKKECDYVVVSLFVNPTQFGPNEDFSTYPRNLTSDRKQAREVGVDLLWTPIADELYPPPYRTWIDVDALGQRWEGAARPGHFRGVATIVAKLFHVVQPDVAYFGQKDYQQSRIIRQMTRDLQFDVAIQVLPTVRESDGLAMSSRNAKLSVEARAAAPILYQALCRAARSVQEGERNGKCLARQTADYIRKSVPHAQVEYAALCDPDTLLPIDRIEQGKMGIFLLAIRLGEIRLIDNMYLEIPHSRL